MINLTEEQEEKLKRVVVIVLALLILLLPIIIYCIFCKEKLVNDVAASNASTGLSSEKSQVDNNDSSPAESTDNGFIKEWDLDGDGNYEKEFAMDDQNTGSKKIGLLTITYDPEMAQSGTGSIGDSIFDLLTFHNGTGTQVYGIICAYKWYGTSRPNSIDEAKVCVNEYIASNTGITSDWEECEQYFIRKISAYDMKEHQAILYYTVIPKNTTTDNNAYIISYVTSGENTIGDAIYESCFDCIYEPVKNLIPDSTFLAQDYETTWSELQYTFFYHHAKGAEGYGGLDSLREANNSWYMKVYGYAPDGSTGIPEVTEEEAAENYQEYTDPVGTAQGEAKKELTENEEEGLRTEALDDKSDSDSSANTSSDSASDSSSVE
ncbi:hypothetical protein [Butyrivibrio fibrisolvens]|uniref:hypothetical protein n=1 Tax=Butyrivibrio fibrisolvens TaxID=831 RepID=UPI0003B758D5|nr:hypothetical protein [Butyrivibrio fibrisolvens]